jgi:hypothetical protein
VLCRPTGATRITSRITATAKISYFRVLPGAEFRGDIDSADVETAARLQQIRAEFEDAIGYMRADLLEMGFDPSELDHCAADPARITSCAYVSADAMR